MSIETMKLALDALEYLDVTAEHYVDDRIPYAAITALRQAIEQKQEPDVSNKLHFDCEFVDGTCADLTVYGSERDIKRLEARIKFWWNLEQAQKQEPVAWAQLSENGKLIDLLEEPCKGYVPLYTSPPQRHPLSDEEIGAIATESQWGFSPHDDTLRFARAIEAAHGIKGEA